MGRPRKEGDAAIAAKRKFILENPTMTIKQLSKALNLPTTNVYRHMDVLGIRYSFSRRDTIKEQPYVDLSIAEGLFNIDKEARQFGYIY